MNNTTPATKKFSAKKKAVVSAIAGAALAVTLIGAPASAATAATPVKAKSSSHYSLTVSGSSKSVTIVYLTGLSSAKDIHATLSKKLPWKKSVAASSKIIEVEAVQTGGSKISCEIKNPKGKVVATSTSYGKNSIATCIVLNGSLSSISSSLLSGLGSAATS